MSGPERCNEHQLRALIPTSERTASRPMSQLIELASGQITSTETLIVVLAKPDGMPASVIIHWPSKPITLDPRAFPHTAEVAAGVFAAAVVQLARSRRGNHL
jgi:hypothetical protein